jgi:hypothetical protein
MVVVVVAAAVVTTRTTTKSFEQYESTTEYLWCLLAYKGKNTTLESRQKPLKQQL